MQLGTVPVETAVSQHTVPAVQSLGTTHSIVSAALQDEEQPTPLLVASKQHTWPPAHGVVGQSTPPPLDPPLLLPLPLLEPLPLPLEEPLLDPLLLLEPLLEPPLGPLLLELPPLEPPLLDPLLLVLPPLEPPLLDPLLPPPSLPVITSPPLLLQATQNSAAASVAAARTEMSNRWFLRRNRIVECPRGPTGWRSRWACNG